MSLSSLISLNVILCENILQETDQTYSAIRITDVFYLKRSTGNPTVVEPIKLNILAMGKTYPDDKVEHSAQLIMVFPDGERSPMGEPLLAIFEAQYDETSILAEGSNASDIAGGFSIRAEFTVFPKKVGMYQIAVLIDGEPAARVPFTILELKSNA